MKDIEGENGLRHGFTTGSCAAVTSKAALIMLLTGEDIHNAGIVTPKGPVYNAEILDIKRSGASVGCSVIKDGGDDPDITDGCRINATVSFSREPGIRIRGGEGVGTVTKPGLDQPVGEAAINSVPRRMIRDNLEEVLESFGRQGQGLEVTISVPDGKELAKKTFNPRLGIEGGISILGTTGIVDPMSDAAVIDTIRVQIRVQKARGKEVLLVSPGNYGLAFLKQNYSIDENDAVLCSNFVYDTVKAAREEGFSKMLFVGHLGKLVKVAGGIKNTHSSYGDRRMEILSELISEFIPGDPGKDIQKRILDCVMTDEAVRIIDSEGFGDRVFPLLASRIKEVMEGFSGGNMSIETIVFSNEYKELVRTDRSLEYLRLCSRTDASEDL